MRAAHLLNEHHGSRPPKRSVDQTQMCLWCGIIQDRGDGWCGSCQSLNQTRLPGIGAGVAHAAIWTCECGKPRGEEMAFCEQCGNQQRAPVFQQASGQFGGQVQGVGYQKMAPFLKTHPRCPLPPPPPGKGNVVRRPPVVWRSQGSHVFQSEAGPYVAAGEGNIIDHRGNGSLNSGRNGSIFKKQDRSD